MIQLALAVLAYVPTFLRSRHDPGLEILALCQQLAVFKRRILGPASGAATASTG